MKLMGALLLVPVLAALAFAVWDDDGGGAPGSVADPPTVLLEEVTAEEAAQAEEALRASGRIEEINGGQPWSVRYYTTTRSGTEKVGVYMGIEWEAPVSSEGPWTTPLCQDTVSVTREVLWHNLRAIDVMVTLERGGVALFMPGAAEGADPVNGVRGEVRSYVDEQALRDVEPLPTCPAGLEDDD